MRPLVRGAAPGEGDAKAAPKVKAGTQREKAHAKATTNAQDKAKAMAKAKAKARDNAGAKAKDNGQG